MNLLINIDVDDLDKAIAFYCTAFSLRVGRRLGATVVELLGSSAPIYLLLKSAGSAAAPNLSQPRDYHRHWTPIHLDFVVDDITAAVQTATGVGAVLEGTIDRHSWGLIAHLSDPFGHGICLIQFVGRGYDELIA